MEATYKVFTTRGDRRVKVEEIPALVAKKEIKPETRILNNETKSWIDFKDYKRLHTILKALPEVQPEDGDTYKVLLDGGHHDLSIYRLERLVKNGRITPETRVCNKETGSWVALKECGTLYKTLYSNSTNPHQQEEKKPVESEYLHECPQCHHLYSKRADKCPKCGNVVHVTCSICKGKIPKSSTSCPECGDPEPFGDARQVTQEKPVIFDKVSTQRSQEALPLPQEMQPSMRWTIIIGSTLAVMILFATIHTYREDAGYRGKPQGLVIPPVITFFLAHWLTRSRKNPSDTIFATSLTETQRDNSSEEERKSPDNSSYDTTLTSGCCITVSVLFGMVLAIYIILGLIVG